VQECSSCTSCAIDDGFGENLDVLTVIGVGFAGIVDEAAPAAPDADDPISVAERADCNGSNGRIQTRDIAAAGQNSNGSLFQLISPCFWR
jgi:hypothetical protein